MTCSSGDNGAEWANASEGKALHGTRDIVMA